MLRSAKDGTEKSGMSKFAVFIITHGRPNNQYTYQTLRNCGYTGDIYFVVDSMDRTVIELEYKHPGVPTYTFLKSRYMEDSEKILDGVSSSALFARNACEDFAQSLGIDVFAVFDDDITGLRYRWLEDGKIRSLCVQSGLDEVFKLYASFILEHDIMTTSFAHVMFYVGGANNLAERISNLRDTYQIHIRNAKHPVDWLSVINEDIITEIDSSKKGNIWWSLPFVVYDAQAMNDNGGGNKEYYETISATTRALLATVVCPNCCSVGYSHGKIRILQNRKASYPMIISGRYKKK